MAYKNISDQIEYQRKWYLKNKVKVKGASYKSNKLYRQRNIKFVNNYKLEKGCSDCGYNENAVALDFDHISDNKTANVCRMVQDSFSLKKIQEEIDKCEVVCANCHRIRTFERIS